jgi:hypothetical protein
MMSLNMIGHQDRAITLKAKASGLKCEWTGNPHFTIAVAGLAALCSVSSLLQQRHGDKQADERKDAVANLCLQDVCIEARAARLEEAFT